MEPPHADHIATLLVVGIGIKKIISDILQHILQGLSSHFINRDSRVGNGHLRHEIFQSDI